MEPAEEGAVVVVAEAAGAVVPARCRPRRRTPDYTVGVKAIDAGQFAAAIPLLQKSIARDGSNADAYNWLAYATRRNGDPTGWNTIYQKALAIDPKHRGAHEYIGEAYLTLDNLPKAKEHLANLDEPASSRAPGTRI